MSSGKHDISKKGRLKKLRSQVALPGPWRSSSWVNSFGGKGASPLKFDDVSPSFVLRQLQVLVEKGKFVDASQLLNKITIESLKEILMDIPIEPITESIPKSLVTLESLYSRLFVSDAENFPVEQFQVEVMVFHIVRYLSMLQSSVGYKYPKPEDAKKSIVNILRIVLHVNPDLVRTLYKRKKVMDVALQGIGEHGLVEMNGSLINLHDALKHEIGRNISAYKGTVHTLEHLSLSHSKPVTLKANSEKKSGQGLNHQALTKFNENQVKNRLFKNKALLNAIESCTDSKLPALITTLKDRIEYDKSALLAFGKLKSEIKTFSSQTKVVPLLAQYSRSLQLVLDMFKDLLDEHCTSDDKSSYSTLGYHSDEEDLLSVQGANEDNTNRAEEVAQPEIVVENAEQKPPTSNQAEQIPVSPDHDKLSLPADQDSHDKLSLPGEEIPEKRSRWWKHHRRSRSVDASPAMTRRQSNSSEQGLRSTSVDRSTISRPRRESVEESHEFQQMMSRIRDLSASSPAVGRRQLERRGIGQHRSRDSSISPAALRRHFFGEVEKTPSISSQTDNAKDDVDPLYATIKPKAQRLQNHSKDPPKDDTVQAKRLEEVLKERDNLASRERTLMMENARLKETLRMVTMEMESLTEQRKDSAEDEVFVHEPVKKSSALAETAPQESRPKEEPINDDLQKPSPAAEQESTASSSSDSGIVKEAVLAYAQPVQPLEPVVIVTSDAPQISVSSPDKDAPSSEITSDAESTQTAALESEPISPSIQEVLSPESEPISPKQADPTPNPEPVRPVSPAQTKKPSFVEQQKEFLKEQAQGLSHSNTKTHEQPAEELPQSSVQQRKVSYERQLKASSPETTPPPVKKTTGGDSKQGQLKSNAAQLSDEQKRKEYIKQKFSTNNLEVILIEQKPSSSSPQETASKRDMIDKQGTTHKQKESTVQQEPDAKKQPSTQNEKSPSESLVPKKDETESTKADDSPLPQKSSEDKQKPVSRTHRDKLHKLSSPKKPKSATFASQLHLAAIPESSPQATHPKSASIVSNSPNDRLSKGSNEKTTHTNRHLPKNLLRHVTGDLLYEYDKLYSEQRAVAWTGLTVPPEDKDSLLFSVIVFAFQSAQTTIHELHMAKARMLQIPTTDDEESVSSYTIDIPPDNRSQVELLEHLRRMGELFDFKPMIADVMEQLFEVSEHHQILKDSAPLKKFVTSCVILAWRLSIQPAPYVIDFELRSFDPAAHQRVTGANRKSARVLEHIWPSLLESTKGMCVYRGVVLT